MRHIVQTGDAHVTIDGEIVPLRVAMRCRDKRVNVAAMLTLSRVLSGAIAQASELMSHDSGGDLREIEL